MKKYLDFAVKTAEKTGNELLKDFYKPRQYLRRGTAKEVKSYFDKVADKLIISEIRKNFPKSSYLTEETGYVDKKSEYLWIIDPIDGTANFENGNPLFSVSIALWYKNEPLIGIVEAPAINERFLAVKGQGSFLTNLKTKNKRKVHVSNIKDLSKAYLVYCAGGGQNKESMKFVDELLPRAKDMRKLGSAAIELSWVGCGRSDAYITPKISLWDIAAGILFVKEAGGKIMDFNLKPHKFKDLAKHKGYTINLAAVNQKLKLSKIKY